MKLTWLYSNLKSDLNLIEKELEKAVFSDSELLQTASLQLLRAGGKRIRPIFVLLSAKFGKYEIQTIKDVALTLELIHMASLVHDDVEIKQTSGEESQRLIAFGTIEQLCILEIIFLRVL